MKDKTKKVLKTIGLVVLSLFATLGVVLGGLLIGEMGKGSNKPVMVEKERTSLRSSPKMKPQEGDNLLNGFIDRVAMEVNPWTWYASANSNFYTYRLDLAEGYYFLGYNFQNANNEDWYFFGGVSNSGWTSCVNSVIGGTPYMWNHNGTGWRGIETGDNTSYFYYTPSSGENLFVTCHQWNVPSLYLVDTLSVPASSTITLSSNWNAGPLASGNSSKLQFRGLEFKWLGDTGYIRKTDGSAISSDVGDFAQVAFSGFLFRNQGRVYNRFEVVFQCVDFASYLGTDGDGKNVIVTDSNTDIWVCMGVNYYFVKEQYLDYAYLEAVNDMYLYKYVAASPVMNTYVGGVSYYTGGLTWSNEESRKLEILDDFGTSSRYSGNATKGKDFALAYDLPDLEVLRKYSDYVSRTLNIGDLGFEMGLELVTSAFSSVLPLLSISILPNITLGMLLLLPLIAGIIVLIIKAVKK